MASPYVGAVANYIGSWITTFQDAWNSWQRPRVQVTVPDAGFTWEQVKDQTKPYPDMGLSYDEFKKTFGFWFNYFWEEARQCAEAMASPTSPSSPGGLGLTEVLGAQADVTELRRNLCLLFGEVFSYNPQTKAFTPRPGVDGRSDDQLFNILMSLLVIGFKPFPLSEIQAIQDSSPLFTDQIVYGSNRQIIQLAFRADSRTWLQIYNAGGCKRRVDADDQRHQFALDKKWHPFSDTQVRACLWFRRGAKNLDNCLHSVVSIGPKFSEIIQFPKISDATSYPGLSRKPLDQWDASDISYATSKNIARRGDATSGYYLETQTSIYVFKVNGMKVYNTQAQQVKEKGTPYTERGADAVPVDNLLARVVVTRQHKDGAEEFHLKKVLFQGTPKWEPLSDENELKGKLFGSDEALQQFKAFMDRLTSGNPIANEQMMEAAGPQAKDAGSARGGFIVTYRLHGNEQTLTVQSTNEMMAKMKGQGEVRKLGGEFLSIRRA